MKKIIYLLCVITFLLSCDSVNVHNEKKEEVLSKTSEPKLSDCSKMLMEIYGLPADSVKLLEEAAKTRYNYSIYDMIDDEGNLVWKASEDDPFKSENLDCMGIMLADTMMYRLVNDMVRLRNYYEGDMKAMYDWLWHEEMMKEIDTYLKTTYPKKKKFDFGDYEQVIYAMINYVSPLADGYDYMMGENAEVCYHAKCLLLIEEYKEAVRHCTHSPELAKAYIEDYRLWMDVIEELVKPDTSGGLGTSWYMASYISRGQMVDFRLEFLRDETSKLWLESASDDDNLMMGQFKFDNKHYALSKWYNMRNAVKEMKDCVWYSNTTNSLVKEYMRKESELMPMV